MLFFGRTQCQEKSPTKDDALDKFGFSEHILITDSDTVTFILHKKKNSNPVNLVLYLQGTSPDPFFVIEENQGKAQIYRWFPGDYKNLDSSYCYAVIAKTGIPVLFNENDLNIEKYHQFNTLDQRVFQADTVINYISTKILKNPQKVIVYGHSEGAPVAAKLGTINKKITHLGFWAGSALSDYYDFVLFNCKASWANKISKEEAHENIMNLFNSFNEISKYPNDTFAEDRYDYSNKRWWSYAEPPINHLLKIDIPIFVQAASNDESAPVESNYLIPLEFMRLGKTNLTFEVCLECDHGFESINENGEKHDKWDEIFRNFIEWTEG